MQHGAGETAAEAAVRTSPAVLVTGCSSGIGHATAARLVRHGWAVWATARRPETLEALAEAGCRTLRLDVCDEASMVAAVAAVEAEHGAVGALVNNAGYGLMGPVEELDVAEVRRQFETNLFGPMRLVQLVLPGMRDRRWGRIVVVGSVAGRISLPGGGAYHASKHALEALHDALRFEVQGFGVDVVVVEPGAIRTRWTEKAVTTAGAAHASGIYAPLRGAVRDRLEGANRGVLGLAAGSADAVARVIERAVDADRPRTRYRVPPVVGGFIAARRLLPDRAWDTLQRRLYPTPRPDG